MIKSIKNYIPVILCVFLSFTQLKVFLPFINTLAVMVLGLGISFMFYRDFYKQAFIRWIVVYIVVLLVNNLLGDYYFKLITNVVEEICLLLFPAAFAYFIITRKKYNVATWLIVAFFLLIIYSSITTFIVDMLFPDAVRSTVALMNNEDTELLRMYYGMGMVTYKFTHSLPVLIPALVYATLRSRTKLLFRVMAFITLLAVLLTVYLSNATTVLILALCALFASLLVSKKSTGVTLVRLVGLAIIAIPFLIDSGLLVDLLNSISSFLGSETNAYADRLEDVKYFSETGKASGDLGGRVDKYSISFSILEGNVLWGSDSPTGEHSAILDRLACLGLLGWIPYMVYIIKNTIRQKRLLSNSNIVNTYYLIGAGTALLMLTTKNMSGWDMWFMFFCLMPVVLWLYSNESNEVIKTIYLNNKQ